MTGLLVCSAPQAKAAPAVVLLKSFDEPVTPYSGEYTDAAITQFALSHSEPVLAEMDQCAPPREPLYCWFKQVQTTCCTCAIYG